MKTGSLFGFLHPNPLTEAIQEGAHVLIAAGTHLLDHLPVVQKPIVEAEQANIQAAPDCLGQRQLGIRVEGIEEKVDDFLHIPVHKPLRHLQRGNTDSFRSDRQITEEALHFGKGETAVPHPIPQGVIDPVCRQVGKGFLQQGPISGENRFRMEAVLSQDGVNLRFLPNPAVPAFMQVLLPLPVYIIHHVGKGRMAHIVQQPRNLLLQTAAQPADEQHHPHRMFVPGHVPLRLDQTACAPLMNPLQALNGSRSDQIGQNPFHLEAAIQAIGNLHFLFPSNIASAAPVKESGSAVKKLDHLFHFLRGVITSHILEVCFRQRDNLQLNPVFFNEALHPLDLLQIVSTVKPQFAHGSGQVKGVFQGENLLNVPSRNPMGQQLCTSNLLPGIKLFIPLKLVVNSPFGDFTGGGRIEDFDCQQK
jgi:hypothetical protein